MGKFPVLFFVAIFSTPLFVTGEGMLYFRCKETYIPETGRCLNLGSDTVAVNTVKFYLQYISISRHNKRIWQSTNSHLVDLSESDRIAISTPVDLQVGDSLFFTLGIDSATSVSGVQSGDLDPTSGMFWTWRSGYINLKIEGTSSLSKARDHEFQFHLGGYEQPHPTAQDVHLEIVQDDAATIIFSLGDFLLHTNISSVDHVMSPGESAAKLSKAAATAFYMHQP